MTRIKIILTLVLICISHFSFSQKEDKEEKATKEKKASDDEKKNGLVGLPVLYYSPETRLAFGAAGIYFFRTKNTTKDTRVSSLQFLATYTQNKQTLLTLPYIVHFKDNIHIVKGELTWFKYPLQFFGIGAYARDIDEETFTSTTIVIRADYLYKVRGSLYLGGRYRMDGVTSLSLADSTKLLSEGTIAGYDGGIASGLGFLVSYDRRDNVFTPMEGPFVESSVSVNAPFLGSDFSFVRFDFDARYYYNIIPNHQLALNAVTQAVWGDVPFTAMPMIGNTFINRGYYQGRYRDKVQSSIQAEYRLNLFRGDRERESLSIGRRFGVVAFGGLSNVAPSIGQLSTNEIKYSYGAGIRFLASRKENMNIRFDYARGRAGSSGIYVTVGEAF